MAKRYNKSMAETVGKSSAGKQAQENITSLVPAPSTKKKATKKMIDVIKLVFWDGSKFLIRKDDPYYNAVLLDIRRRKRAEFLVIPMREQVKVAQSGGMMVMTEVQMDEKKYLKVKKG